MSKPFDPKREEIFTVKEDLSSDYKRYNTPWGRVEGHGLMSSPSINFNKMAAGHPMIRYKDLIIEADVYVVGDETTVHIYCPRCLHNLQISSKRKQIDWDPVRQVISIEPFECTWELGERDDERMAFGVGLCRLRMAVDKNVGKDA